MLAILKLGVIWHDWQVLEPAAVIVEIINADGTMARRDDLEIFAKEHDIKIGTIADLINYRIANEQTVEEVESLSF